MPSPRAVTLVRQGKAFARVAARRAMSLAESSREAGTRANTPHLRHETICPNATFPDIGANENVDGLLRQLWTFVDASRDDRTCA